MRSLFRPKGWRTILTTCQSPSPYSTVSGSQGPCSICQCKSSPCSTCQWQSKTKLYLSMAVKSMFYLSVAVKDHILSVHVLPSLCIMGQWQLTSMFYCRRQSKSYTVLTASGSVALRNLSICNPKNLFTCSRKDDPGCLMRTLNPRSLDFFHPGSRIPGPGVKKTPDP